MANKPVTTEAQPGISDRSRSHEYPRYEDWPGLSLFASATTTEALDSGFDASTAFADSTELTLGAPTSSFEASLSLGILGSVMLNHTVFI